MATATTTSSNSRRDVKEYTYTWKAPTATAASFAAR